MKNKSNKSITDWSNENPRLIMYAKYSGVLFSVVVAIYLIGYAFKISANTVKSYNDLRTALKG